MSNALLHTAGDEALLSPGRSNDVPFIELMYSKVLKPSENSRYYQHLQAGHGYFQLGSSLFHAAVRGSISFPGRASRDPRVVLPTS